MIIVLLVVVSVLSVGNGMHLLQKKVAPSLRTVDLRSDTITRPTNAMRKQAMEAEVGDDVFGEDPTVNALETRVAKIFNKEKALFFPTGTMSNLAALMSWCDARGSEMILGDQSHIHIYEQGGVAQLGGVATHLLPTAADGTLNIDAVAAAIRPDNIHFPVTQLISLENTHNYAGGRVLPSGYVEALSTVARQNNIPIHLDGARIWNAAVSTGESVAKLVEHVDSVSACLSKGLGAPAGTLLIGPKPFIGKARRLRKALGGGMRQAGILAACGMVALDDFENGSMLPADHRRAKTLAKALQQIPGLYIDPEEDVETNILVVQIELDGVSAAQFLEALKDKGVLGLPRGPRAFRLVLHRDINDEDVDHAASIIRDVTARFWVGTSVTSHHMDLAAAAVSTDATAIYQDATLIHNHPAEVFAPQVNETVAAVAATNVTSQPQVVHAPTFEETTVFGMSVSDDGFCVFLQGMVSDRIVKVAVTPADPMAYGLDKEQVESTEAVTLLQLLQGIDVESYLPREILSQRFGDVKGKFKLRRVMIKSVGIPSGTTSASAFTANICGFQRKTHSNNNEFAATDPNVDAAGASMLQGVQKAMDLLHTVAQNPLDAHDTTAAEPYYTLLNTLHSHGLSGSNGNDGNHNNNNGGESPTAATAATSVSIPVVTLPYKEIELKNAFEVIALALRHKAALEVRSDFLQDENISYTAEEVRQEFLQLLESTPPPIEHQQERIMKEPTFVHRVLERLLRGLGEARRQKREDKAGIARTKIEVLLRLIQAGQDEQHAVFMDPPPLPSSSSSNRTEQSQQVVDVYQR